ncbi:MAG TPA: hypothetical protein VMK12_05765 [Anaeromyxobacteraceae bacterium]|nr:hypothetical protein [Anaeromyxobacteraceae bacterium]
MRLRIQRNAADTAGSWAAHPGRGVVCWLYGKIAIKFPKSYPAVTTTFAATGDRSVRIRA